MPTAYELQHREYERARLSTGNVTLSRIKVPVASSMWTISNQIYVCQKNAPIALIWVEFSMWLIGILNHDHYLNQFSYLEKKEMQFKNHTDLSVQLRL